jgi:hypothetical protein
MITDPISSNQVTEVGILKPACATFCGDSLNDWLKWLSESMCELDVSQLTLEELQGLIATIPTTVDFQVTITSILKSIATLNQTDTTIEGDITTIQSDVTTLQSDVTTLQEEVAGLTECCNLTDTTITVENANMINGWVNFEQGQVYYRKVGKEVKLYGQITGGEICLTAFYLLTGYKPTENQVFLCHCDDILFGFAQVEVLTTGAVRISIIDQCGNNLDFGTAVYLQCSFFTA